MKKIFRVTDNPFDDIEITTARLSDFGADAWPKLAADYPDASAEVKRCVQAVVQGRSGVEQSAAQRLTDTSSLDAFLADVAELMRRSQARIAVDLGEDSAAFAALYPNGRRTYSRLSKTEAPARFLTIRETITATGEALHEPTRLRLLGLADQWERLRTGQQQSEGTLGAQRDERDAARMALEDALYEALLQVSSKNKRNPEAAKRYFDHTLLSAARHSSLEHHDTAAS